MNAGKWHNFNDYRCPSIRVERWPLKRLGFRVTHYAASLPEKPAPRMCWEHPAGFFIEGDQNVIDTDLGSIPPPLRPFFPADEFIRAYAFVHDPGYKHAGLWIAQKLDGEFKFQSLSRETIDVYLKLSAYAEGVHMERPPLELERRVARIHWAVATFGGGAWKNYRMMDHAG